MFTKRTLTMPLLAAALGGPVGACHRDLDAKARAAALAPSYTPKLAELGTTIGGLTGRARAIPAEVPGAAAAREAVFELESWHRSLNIYLAEVSAELVAAARANDDAKVAVLEREIRGRMEDGLAKLTAELPKVAATVARLEQPRRSAGG